MHSLDHRLQSHQESPWTNTTACCSAPCWKTAASYAQLARQVNLSAPAVAERVAKLEASGVITGYQAKVDLEKIGLPIQCVIELRLASHGNQKAYDALASIPELTECHRVTGDPCVIMQAAVGRCRSWRS
jgi:Lrp/AsnC family leucine-responsive transcriptional regulator